MQGNKLKVDLENCYGIRKLEYEFDFNKDNCFTIYAQNGVMKTSFAKSFQDLIDNKESKDLVYPNSNTIRNIKDGDGKDINNENVFVIESYNPKYSSTKISTLLANEKLKREYETIHSSIDEKKNNLIRCLKDKTKFRKGIEEKLSYAFNESSKNFLSLAYSLKDQVEIDEAIAYRNINYKVVFNDKVIKLLETKDFKDQIKEYINTYNKLVESSTFFKKGVFNHNNASDITSNLKKNGFFKANHSVIININGSRKEINNETELTQVIQEEKDSILHNEDLKATFDVIDLKLNNNSELKDFRDYLNNNKDIISDLDDMKNFEKKVWIAYIGDSLCEYNELIIAYETGHKAISSIFKKAKEEQTRWEKVIEIFNTRFYVPFKISIENKEDVILKSDAPSVKFDVQCYEDLPCVPMSKESLLDVLSNGERRALYLLNIIFEIEARKESNQETIFLIDDIADSFDYKNKYAIIEYLYDISKEKKFYQIIMTHNFDFYRTVSNRLEIHPNNRQYAKKRMDSTIIIQKEKYQRKPFISWINKINQNNIYLIALIPFLRNISEYCGHENENEILTSLLHIKEDTKNITLKELEIIINYLLSDNNNVEFKNKTILVIDLIYDVSNKICLKTDNEIELEDKIVLSIGIRLKTEEFLFDKLGCPHFDKFQTRKLINEFKNKFPSEVKILNTIEKVNIMTTENIHLNSFMYEPIIDISNQHLKDLYKEVSMLGKEAVLISK